MTPEWWRRPKRRRMVVLVAACVVLTLLALTISVFASNSSDATASRNDAAGLVPGDRTPVRSSSSTSTSTSTSTSRTSPSTTSTTTAVGTTLLPLAIVDAPAAPHYDRAEFGNWNDPDGDCQNTRAELLITRSAAPVTFTTASDCTVATGSWTDPWSGLTSTVAHDFDIDHTVPLANAWRSGAWQWNRAQRVTYANDLGDADHLVTVIASENRSKGDDGPEAWRPAEQASWCKYATVWDHIKAKWRLSATTAEWAALKEMAATC